MMKISARILARNTSKRFNLFSASEEKIAFNHVAREWRMKYSEGGLTGGAVTVDKVLKDTLAKVKAVEGVVSVQRVVCGACNDFKVLTKVKAANFGDWAEKDFAPEAEFLEACKKVPGVTNVETQTIT